MSIISVLFICIGWIAVDIILDIVKASKTIHGTMEIGKQDLGVETPIYNVTLGDLSKMSKAKYVVLAVKKIDKPKNLDYTTYMEGSDD